LLLEVKKVKKDDKNFSITLNEIFLIVF
jgi:hypothetical protein